MLLLTNALQSKLLALEPGFIPALCASHPLATSSSSRSIGGTRLEANDELPERRFIRPLATSTVYNDQSGDEFDLINGNYHATRYQSAASIVYEGYTVRVSYLFVLRIDSSDSPRREGSRLTCSTKTLRVATHSTVSLENVLLESTLEISPQIE